MNLWQKKHDWILGGFEYLHADTDVEANPGSGGAKFKGDADAGAVIWPYAKVAFGASGTQTPASAANPLPVIQTAALPVTDNGGTLSIDDGAGSITVDGTFWQATQPVSAASLPLPTGAATETTLAALNTKTATAKTSDYDTGAGSDTVEMVGLALPGAGGAVQGGTSTNPLRTDPTGTTAQPVTDNGGTLSVDDGGGALTVDGTVTANAGSGTFAVSAASLPLPTGASTEATLSAASAKLPATLGQKAMAASMAVVLASDQASVPVAATLAAETTKVIGTVNMAAGQTIAATNAGTFAVQAGQAAHDAAITGNPVRIGGRAASADVAAVANGDTVDILADLNGKLVVMPYALPENLVSGATAAITGTSDTEVIAAAGAGIRNYVTQILVTNSHATVGTVVEIKHGTTVLYRGYAAALGGGFAVNLPTPLRGAANAAINAACITTDSSVFVSASGFKAP